MKKLSLLRPLLSLLPLLPLLSCIFNFTASAQVAIPREVIPYNVSYHWGIINVSIAKGTVAVESDGTNFYGTLDGVSIPWEGHIICVSDTLSAQMYATGSGWSETVSYQSGWYRHPDVNTFRSNYYNPANPAIYRNIAGQGQYDASNDSMEAIAVTSDMLGMYYFSHVIDFGALRPGDQVTIPISGGYSHEVVITYQGTGEYCVNGCTYPTYDCSFEYGYRGRMSGYPVECRIGVRDRIPMFLSASLPVGRVEMLYDPD